MSEWRTIRLGSACDKIGSGATPRGGSEVYQATGISLIRSQNIYNDGFKRDGLAFIGDKHARELENVNVLAGDVLLNITGDSVARVCQVPEKILPARVNQHVAIIRPKKNILDARFLHYFLIHPQTQAHMLGLAGAGATRNALTKGMIESFEIKAPSFSEQRAIASVLGALDDKIELNRRMNETLEALAKSQVPQAAVVDVPAGFDAIIAEKDLAAMVKSSPGLNFGSVNIGAGFTTWPPGRNPIGTQRDQAADIFAFDTLIQNLDRRAVNPNLWARSDKLGVYDHELAFSFLTQPIIGGAPKPWQAAKQPKSFQFLEQHIFYRSLRGGRLDFGPFKEKLGRLTDGQIQGYAAAIPADWRSKDDFSDKLVEYLGEARKHRESLIQFIKHLHCRPIEIDSAPI